MIFLNVDDFYRKADCCLRLTRQKEIECAKAMKNGDSSAREQLLQSYLPVVAAHIKRMQPHLQTLGLVMYCVQALEKAVDSFDFIQDSETFSHRLSWWLRDATAKYIVR